MDNFVTNSSTCNTKYQIPESPEFLRNSYVQAQLPQNSNATPKKVEVVLPGRLDFVHVFEPWAFCQNYEPKFFVTLIINKTDIYTIQTIHNAISQAYEIGKWKLQVALQDIRYPLRDGDTEKPDNLAYKNCCFINATRSGKFSAPAVCNIDKKEITDRSQLYSGVWGRVHVSFVAYCIGNQKGIGCYLNAVQKTKDDARIGGVANPFAVFN